MDRFAWWLDLKLGLRMLIRYPGLTLAGVIGIAVSVAIAAGGFSVVSHNMLASSLPLPDGGRIVSIALWDSRAREFEPRLSHHFQLWRQTSHSIEEISAYRPLTMSLFRVGSSPESVPVAAISASGFRVAQVQPRFGRLFTEQDERSASAPVAIIGEALWRTRLGSDPNVLNRTITLGSRSYSVIGVMPEGFRFPINHNLWIPLQTTESAKPLTGAPVRVFGRLAAGAAIENARAEIAAHGHAGVDADRVSHLRPQVTSYTASLLNLEGDDLSTLIGTQGIVIALLVLVCLNIAVLTYTRTASRHAEFGLRTALGAPRRRIVMQLFLEAFVLSAAGTAAGVAIAAFSLQQVEAATRNIAADLPHWISFRLSMESVVYASALSILAAVIVGVIPGLQATGKRLQTGFRVAGTGESSFRMGMMWNLMIAAQVAFAVALLPTAIIHVMENLPHTIAGPGFPAEEYLVAHLGMDLDAQSGTEPRQRYAARHAEVMRRLREDPRVAAVTFSAREPGDERGAHIEAEGLPGVTHEAQFNHVDPGFFAAFDIPVLAGRAFDSARSEQSPARTDTVVVNQALAERLFAGQALGKRIRYVAREAGEEAVRWYEIAGVVRDFPPGVSAGMRDSSLKIYHAASLGQVHPAILAVRIRGQAPAFATPLRAITAAIDPDLVLREVRGLDEALRKEQWIVRLEASVMLAVTVSVLLLAVLGVYALMSFTVSQRRREIGIRIALGAGGRGIVTSVFSRVAIQVGSGAAIGAVISIALNRHIGTEAGRNVATLLIVVVILAGVGFAAAAGPARRSLRVQPAEALRNN
ncbi:MAG: ABC transporter permease [Bryobacterales bacterium]|nr:ABC transporter permease [Bryobacterales bacterium]